MTSIKAIKGDITLQAVDVIVNNASPTLLGGGGVDGAIHEAAGPALLEECRSLGGCRTGEAKITRGYNLPAKYVIHTVGPVYGRENGLEAELLANCYKNTLRLAKDHSLKTLAFPAIATGIYGYPIEEAAKVAVKAVREFVALHDFFTEIIFVLYTDYDHKVYEEELKNAILIN